MSGNGRRRPPRPRIEIAAGGASEEEAAAIAAALQRFMADTAPPPAAPARPDPWQQAALLEGVTAKVPALPPDPGSGFPPAPSA
ncbi:MAG: hypothetical protein U0R52_12600 [Solirubrobacterales bacterium]